MWGLLPTPDRAKWGIGLVGLFSVAGAACPSLAQETACSVVRIDIRQELTLERQAFDAHMRITNALDTSALTDVGINVWFRDADGNAILASSDPDHTDAEFFIALDSTSGIDSVEGGGTIAAGATADIYWIIIPAPGSAGSSPSGRLVQIGASLSYTLAGEAETIEVAPDFVTVRPMPRLELDYFLPAEVIANDPLVPEEQDPIPFPLAVRVTNSGYGAANGLEIESARPEIVDNAQGLLINFELLSASVNDGPAANSLLAELGDLPAGGSATAVWSMMVSLYGRFVDFEADYTHSDSLGGALTSLIDRVDTHTLIGLVVNDLPGRDGQRDFLARDGNSLRLYESEGVDTGVTDHSSASSLTLIEQTGQIARYRWEFPETAGAAYARLPDPTGGAGRLDAVWRDDGKSLRPENFWQLPTKESGDWQHQVHLFDVDSGGGYQLEFRLADEPNRPPVIDPVGGQIVAVGDSLGVLITASDPDADPISFSVPALPANASFIDSGNGQATLEWAPAPEQVGDRQIEILASDGQLTSTSAFTVTVEPAQTTPGLLISAPETLVTDEAGAEAAFTVRLTAAPSSDVEVAVASSDTGEATVTPGILSFTSADWDQPRNVTVKGVDDQVLDGDRSYHIDVGPSTSSDTDFSNLTHAALPGINEDDDVAELRVSPTSGLATAGAASGARFRVSLAAKPADPVTLSVISDRPEWGEVVDAEIVLDSSNWETGKEVVVEGQDDPLTDVGDHPYHVSVVVVAGGDPWLEADAETIALIHRAGDTWGIATGRISIPAVDSSSGFWRFDFEYPFDQVPVVVLVGDDNEPKPASVRVRNVDEYGFELVQVQPPAIFGPSAAMEVHFLAVSPGHYPFAGGGEIEAGRLALSNSVDHDKSFDWRRVEFTRAHAKEPALLTSLQTMANETANVPQSASAPWLTVAVGAIDGSGFSAALERASVMHGSVESPETIGWIAWRGAFGGFASDSGWVRWQGNAGNITAAPWTAGCSSSSMLGAMLDEPVAVTGLHTRRNPGGGWLRLCTHDNGALGILIDQDVELDETRGAQVEDVGAVLFDRGFQTRLPTRPQLLFRDDFESE